MNKANLSFLIVWAAKSWTTYLASYLNNHPDVFIPNTEARFFSNVRNLNGLMADFFMRTFIREKDDYNHLFLNTRKRVLGEKSPCYLYYYEESIKNIKKYYWDDIKIIILLRNPIERAFSQYKHSLKYWYENISFEDSLKFEVQRKKDNWYYIFLHKEVWLYYESVKAYKENFKNVKIYLFDDLKNDKDYILSDMYDYLWVQKIVGLNDSKIQKNEGIVFNNNLDKFISENLLFEEELYDFYLNYIEKYKKLLSEKVYNPMISREYFSLFLSNYKKNIKHKSVEISDEIKKELQLYYQEDIKKTGKLIWKDLSYWLK